MAQFFTAENLKVFLQKNPESVAFAHLAARYIDEGEHQKAIELCQKGISKHPDYAFGHFILGSAHYHVKNYTDAKKSLEKALAYDPSNPRAWEILSAINEILNLTDDARQSNLQAFLVDFFNQNTSVDFMPDSEVTPPIGKDRENLAPAEETDLEAGLDKSESDQDVDDMLENVISGGQEEYDFDKALDEVFKSKEAEAKKTDVSLESAESVPGDTAGKESYDSVTGDLTEVEAPKEEDEGTISADEFTSAIESFFSTYEDEEPDAKKPVGEVEIPDLDETVVPESGSDVEPSEGLGSVEELEEIEPQEMSEDTEPEQVFHQPPSEEKTADDELLDFRAFVSDIIKDSDETPSEPEIPGQEQEVLPTEDTVVSDISESDIQFDLGQQIQEIEQELPAEEDFNLPDQPAAEAKEDQDSFPAESLNDLPDIPKKTSTGAQTAKFSKPPILSPTLGEIYIAQGRFDEAIEVFNQLLDKDPQNTRFKRKIEDLQKIIAKKKSGTH